MSYPIISKRPKPTIEKIEFTKEQQDLIDKINKGEPIKRTRLSKNKVRGYEYEVTTNKPLTYSAGIRRLGELYGGTCPCGQWPSYKVSYDVGDEQQPARLVERYCSTCFEKNDIK